MSYEVADNGESRTGIPIKRITWDDGKWWDVLAEMPYRVTRELAAVTAPVARLRIGAEGIVADTDDERGAETLVRAMSRHRMVRLKGCTVAWSWEMKVSDEAIADMRPETVNDVLRVMDELHTEDTEGLPDDEKKASASLSSTGYRSGVNGSTPSST